MGTVQCKPILLFGNKQGTPHLVHSLPSFLSPSEARAAFPLLKVFHFFPSFFSRVKLNFAVFLIHCTLVILLQSRNFFAYPFSLQ